MELGDKIKYLRTLRDMTQKELSEKTGISDTSIQKYEYGKVDNISRKTLVKLAQVLGCSASYLMGYDDEMFIKKSDERTIKAFTEFEKLLMSKDPKDAARVEMIEKILDI